MDTANITSENNNKLLLFSGIVSLLALVFLGIVFIPQIPQQLICRKSLFSPLVTGFPSEKYEFGNNEFKALHTYACIVKVESVSENEARVKIGYFDKFKILHFYTAKFGGDKPFVGICSGEEKCWTGIPSEAVTGLSRGQVKELFLIIKDTRGDIMSITNQTLAYDLFINNLKVALLEKGNFPPDTHPIQISQIKL